MTISGATDAVVRDAIDNQDPLPGTAGFAGTVDGHLVRDVLGRYPLFYERQNTEQWSHDRTELDDPVCVSPGSICDEREIEQLWSLPQYEPLTDRSDAIRSVRHAVDTTLDAVDSTGVAVAFSGGLDSALLAARLDAPLYTVGFPESHDVQAGKSAARALGRECHVIELDHTMLEDAISTVVAATGRTNPMDVQIAAPLALVAERARADGYDRLAVGQGADELFGGYDKVANAAEDPRVGADTVRGARRELLETLPNQLERDGLVLRSAGIEPVMPLLHDRVVRAGLELSDEMLVSERGERKWALRLAARRWVPDDIVFREKKAVQYGSQVARELDRLARQSGFKPRLDNHITQYIEQLDTD
jgi:asparagine synthase (glutamine-hydrolysing)